MTPDQRTELQRLAEAATPGPWFIERPGKPEHGWFIYSDAFPADDGRSTIAEVNRDGQPLGLENTNFIAAANPAAILDLLSLAAQGEDWKQQALEGWEKERNAQQYYEEFHRMTEMLEAAHAPTHKGSAQASWSGRLALLIAQGEELRAENERLKTWIEDHQRRDQRFHELQDPRVEALETRYQDLVNAAKAVCTQYPSARGAGPNNVPGVVVIGALHAALAALLPPQGTDEGAPQ